MRLGFCSFAFFLATIGTVRAQSPIIPLKLTDGPRLPSASDRKDERDGCNAAVARAVTGNVPAPAGGGGGDNNKKPIPPPPTIPRKPNARRSPRSKKRRPTKPPSSEIGGPVSPSPTLPPSSPPTTRRPTLSPTLSPTRLPTKPPTLSPTLLPTLPPTLSPTLPPTRLPTKPPTLSPTLLPTLSPTLPPSSTPTRPPTLSPTLPPSLHPTLPPSLPPTLFPTKPPTSSPTFLPTKQPTLPPTLFPTKIPTSQPTEVQCDTAYPCFQVQLKNLGKGTTSFQGKICSSAPAESLPSCGAAPVRTNGIWFTFAFPPPTGCSVTGTTTTSVPGVTIQLYVYQFGCTNLSCVGGGGTTLSWGGSTSFTNIFIAPPPLITR